MDSIELLDAFVTDKPTDMEVEQKITNDMDVDPTVLMLGEEGAYWEPPAIMEATIELKNWAWEGVTHPMENFVRKIKTVKSVSFAKKIKTAELVTFAKNIVSVPIESISTNVFMSKIGKETLNNKELKHGYLEPIIKETQTINLGTDDEPKMIQVGNTLTTL